MKLLNPKTHGYIDCVIVALFLLAPTLFNFVDGAAASISYTMGILILAVALLTAYPLGVIKAIPFTVHGWIEFAASIALIAMPGIAGFGYDDRAQNFFVGMGLVAFGFWALSDYKVEAPSRSWAVHHGLARG